MKYYASIWDQIAIETSTVNNTFNVTPSVTTTSTNTPAVVPEPVTITQTVNDAIDNNNVSYGGGFSRLGETRMSEK
jgi:hypothetical protein